MIKIRTLLTFCISLLFITPTLNAKDLISIIVTDPNNPYWYTEGQVAAQTARELGYEAKVSAHLGSLEAEIKEIQKAIDDNAKGIVLDPADADKSSIMIQKAKESGIPVILVNSQIKQENIAIGQLFSNNRQGALIGAQQWSEMLPQKGSYFELIGNLSDVNAMIRSEGYDQVLSKDNELIKAESQVANWDRRQGYTKTKEFLSIRQDIVGVIAGNDEMALGAIMALKELGLDTKVTVGGFDGSPDAIGAIQSGDLAYTVLQPVAVFSKEAVIQLDSFLKTGTTGIKTERQSFNCILINKENVKNYTAPFVLSE